PRRQSRPPDGPRRSAAPARRAADTAAAPARPGPLASRETPRPRPGLRSAHAPATADGDTPDTRSARWFADTPPGAARHPSAEASERTSPGRDPQPPLHCPSASRPGGSWAVASAHTALRANRRRPTPLPPSHHHAPSAPDPGTPLKNDAPTAHFVAAFL